MKFREIDIKKTNDIQTAHDIYWNSHDYLLLYENPEKKDMLMEPKFVYSNEGCVAVIEPVLQDQYYELFIKEDINPLWTTDILFGISERLFFDQGIDQMVIQCGDLTCKDKKFYKQLRKDYDRESKKRQKRYNQIQTLQDLQMAKKRLEIMKLSYDISTINIEYDKPKAKGKVK